MARLYADENFPFPVVEELRRLGHDVVTSYEAGQASQSVSDAAALGLAAADGRAVVTLNRRHFVRSHTTAGPTHAGIIVCTRDLDFIGQAGRIHAASGSRTVLSGLLIRVNGLAPER